MKGQNIKEQLTLLDDLSLAELREYWLIISPNPIPRLSAAMLRLALAWEIQAQANGGLPRRYQQQLEQIANGKTKTQTQRVGMRLVREWNGALHVVTIEEDGIIHWNDQEWKSLSQVAKAITGTHWSGPAFFGLKKRAAA